VSKFRPIATGMSAKNEKPRAGRAGPFCTGSTGVASSGRPRPTHHADNAGGAVSVPIKRARDGSDVQTEMPRSANAIAICAAISSAGGVPSTTRSADTFPVSETRTYIRRSIG
jgi:hypothetical protein